MSFDLSHINKHTYTQKQQKLEKKVLPTARGVPRRSPIQVLTAPDVAWLQWSDENWYVQRGMAVDTELSSLLAICLTWNADWNYLHQPGFEPYTPCKHLYFSLIFIYFYMQMTRQYKIFINRNHKNMRLVVYYCIPSSCPFKLNGKNWLARRTYR